MRSKKASICHCESCHVIDQYLELERVLGPVNLDIVFEDEPEPANDLYNAELSRRMMDIQDEYER